MKSYFADTGSMKIKTHPFNTLGNYKYVDIISLHKGKWIFSKHKKRATWETQGGHIEKGETPLEAARRELFEEAGAIQFDIKPLCDYSLCGSFNDLDISGNGQVFFAIVYTLSDIPIHSEMEEICLFDFIPDELTYPVFRDLFPIALAKRREIESPIKKILTKRCVLKPLNEADFEELTPLITDEKVRKYLGGVRPLENSLDGLRESMQASNEYLFAVRLKVSNTTIGLVMIAPHHNIKDMEISFMFLPSHWGHGYAGEAIKALLQFCERKLHLSRVVSETQTANARSRSMLENLGYTLENEIERFCEKQCLYVFDFVK